MILHVTLLSSMLGLKAFKALLHFFLSKKLKATKSTLKVWNSNHFGNIQQKIASFLRQLNFIQQSTPLAFTFDQEALLRKSLDDLLI
jgi:hypothetical protein